MLWGCLIELKKKSPKGWTSHWVPLAGLVQHIIKGNTYNLWVNTKPQGRFNTACSVCVSRAHEEALWSESDITFSCRVLFFPPGPHSNFLDHVLTGACVSVMRKKDLWAWSGAEKSIKETCEIYDRFHPWRHLGTLTLPDFSETLGEGGGWVGLDLHHWIGSLSCAHTIVISSPPHRRTASSLWWNLWMEAISCSTFRSPGSSRSPELVSTRLRSRRRSCSSTARESSTGLNQWAPNSKKHSITLNLFSEMDVFAISLHAP